MAVVAAVSAVLYTDPFCPWSWAAEPALRKLRCEFGDEVDLHIVIAGLARQIDAEKARGYALQTLEASAAGGQPADARRWLSDPPSSTYPAAIAFHAVADQADPSGFLRRLREAVFLEGRRMDSPDALMDAARAVGGLDLDRLRIDFGSHAMLERFGEDLERSRSVAPELRGASGDRVAIPTLVVSGSDGQTSHASGTHEWPEWRQAALDAGARPRAAAPPSVEEALRRLGPMTTPEVALVCELPGPRAPAELWRLALEWRVSARRLAGGELWSLPG